MSLRNVLSYVALSKVHSLIFYFKDIHLQIRKLEKKKFKNNVTSRSLTNRRVTQESLKVEGY